MAKQGKDTRIISTPYALRGPIESHMAPMSRRKKTVPATDALLALPICGLVRPRSSRMMGISGAAMKVEQKLMKKENQARWKAVMCGKAKDQRRMTVALPSWSTGRLNLEDLPPRTASAGARERTQLARSSAGTHRCRRS